MSKGHCEICDALGYYSCRMCGSIGTKDEMKIRDNSDLTGICALCL